LGTLVQKITNHLFYFKNINLKITPSRSSRSSTTSTAEAAFSNTLGRARRSFSLEFQLVLDATVLLTNGQRFCEDWFIQYGTPSQAGINNIRPWGI